MMAAHSKLPQRQELFLAALLSQPTVVLAAQKAGISESTGTRWMQDPAFKAAYTVARQRALDEVINALRQSMLSAVLVLRTTMLSDQTRPAQKIQAARSLLELGFQTTTIETLLHRIEALEEGRTA